MGEELSWALHRLALALHEVDLALARRLGLSTMEFTALKLVAMAEHPVGPGDIGHLVGVSSGSASELVDRLVRAGHVERGLDPRDRRRRVVLLTSTAADRLEGVLREAGGDVERLVADSAPELTRPLVEIIDRIGGTLTRWARVPPREGVQ